MRRRNRPYRKIAFGLMAAYALLATTYCVISSWIVSNGSPYIGFRDALVPRLNDVLMFTFFGVVGASVGSFLNVVVWRLPQGLGVNGHSFCPRCRNGLRVYDNVPVLGWLFLEGRCRDCRLPISSRYPIVEAAVGLTFAWVGIVSIYRWNLPYQTLSLRGGLASPIVTPGSLVTLVYHFFGLSILWSMSLTRYDRNRIPWRLIAAGLGGIILAVCILPRLAVVSWQLSAPAKWPPPFPWEPHASAPNGTYIGWLPTANWLVQSIVRVFTALAASGFFARLLSRAFFPDADLKQEPLGRDTGRLIDLSVIFCVIGVLIGWQAMPGVILVGSWLAVAGQIWIRDGRTDALGRCAIGLSVATSLQILFWESFRATGIWPREMASREALLIFAGLTACIPFWLRETQDALGDVANATDPEKARNESNESLADFDDELEEGAGITNIELR